MKMRVKFSLVNRGAQCGQEGENPLVTKHILFKILRRAVPTGLESFEVFFSPLFSDKNNN
jgi:hypothetical protein